MQRKSARYFLVLVMAVLLVGCASQQHQTFKSIEGLTHSAVTPAARETVTWWMPRHNAVNARLTQGNVDLFWIGDSITHGWENAGKEYWDNYYARRNAVNMGFSGDRTQHVLWRLDHSNLENVSPKLSIIMIGTNNSNRNDNTAGEIGDGIIAICARLSKQFPDMKILLLAIFPRGVGPSPQREKNAAASMVASRLADGKSIYYLDINQNFLTADRILPKSIMPDLLHPNQEGYRIWAETIEPTVARLMGEQ